MVLALKNRVVWPEIVRVRTCLVVSPSYVATTRRVCFVVLGLGSLWAAAGSPARAEVANPPPHAEAAKPGVEIAPKTKMALKLAGLVTFVAGSCPELQPDYARFKRAIGVLGVSYADLDKVEIKGMYLSYTLRYKEDVPANCARALKDFGPGGTVIADIVRPKSKAVR